jgi:hypothetical protein
MGAICHSIDSHKKFDTVFLVWTLEVSSALINICEVLKTVIVHNLTVRPFFKTSCRKQRIESGMYENDSELALRSVFITALKTRRVFR